MRIKILASAAKDLQSGEIFYDAQQPGLGDYFLSSLRSDIESLRISAGAHAKLYGEFHRLLSRNFPFAIFYLKEGDDVVIYAVVDCRRDPLWIYDHLDQSSTSK